MRPRLIAVDDINARQLQSPSNNASMRPRLIAVDDIGERGLTRYRMMLQ